MFYKAVVLCAFLGFLIIGAFLATGRYGFAAKAVDYIYYLLLVALLFPLIKNGVK